MFPSLLGAHLSITGGLHQALLSAQKLKCRSLQIFTKNARTWQDRMPSGEEIETFQRTRQETGTSVIVSHASYLINVATPDRKKLNKSKDALIAEMSRSSALGIDYVALHPGAHMGAGENRGIRIAADTLKEILSSPFPARLLIETTAGMGTALGHTFEQIKAILDRTGHEARLGVVLDTSHIFAAGYDIRTREAYDNTLSAFDRIIGLRHLCAIHLNDSKSGLGSFKDRHEHVGRGQIGLTGFKLIMNDPRLVKIPKIIETPKYDGKTPMDKKNLALLANMCSP